MCQTWAAKRLLWEGVPLPLLAAHMQPIADQATLPQNRPTRQRTLGSACDPVCEGSFTQASPQVRMWVGTSSAQAWQSAGCHYKEALHDTGKPVAGNSTQAQP